MEQKWLWLTGQRLMQRWNMHDVEIVRHVMNGLQPYDDVMQPMLPPHVIDWSYLERELNAEITDIEKEYPAVKKSDYHDWCILNHDRQVDSNNHLIEIEFPDGINSEIREEYETKKAQLERLGIKLNKYPSLPSWIGYELSSRKTDRRRVINQLLNALYKLEDIHNLEKIEKCTASSDNQYTPPNEIPQDEVKITPKNAFIRHDDYWKIWYQGTEIEPIIHMDGLVYIAHLLSNPNSDINVSDLYEMFHPKEGTPMVSEGELSQLMITGEMSDSDMAIEELDYISKNQIRERIHELEESIKTADTELEKKESSAELKSIYDSLKLYGKNALSWKAPRRQNESIKRHADAVRKAIIKAVVKIRKRNPALADYLENKTTIKRGNSYTYKSELSWFVSL